MLHQQMGSICRPVFFDESMKRNIKNAMGKAIADGFAPGDMLINTFHGGEEAGWRGHAADE